jgi:hypothetical protein
LALAQLATVGPNLAEIARRVGVPRTTLYGWSDFMKRYNQARSDGATAKRRRRRGRRAGDWDFQVDD